MHISSIFRVPNATKSYLYDNYQFVQDIIFPRLVDTTQLEKNSQSAHLETTLFSLHIWQYTC